MKDTDLFALSQQLIDSLQPIDKLPTITRLLERRAQASARIAEILRVRATPAPEPGADHGHGVVDAYLDGGDVTAAEAKSWSEVIEAGAREERVLRKVVEEIDTRIRNERSSATAELARSIGASDAAQQFLAEIEARATALFNALAWAGVATERMSAHDINLWAGYSADLMGPLANFRLDLNRETQSLGSDDLIMLRAFAHFGGSDRLPAVAPSDPASTEKRAPARRKAASAQDETGEWA